jgi:phosphoribosylamine---glycine ligase
VKVLVIGAGGREHALCYSLNQSPLVSKVIVSPGNQGMTTTIPELQMESVSALNCEGLLELAKKEAVDLTIVGPEATLSLGIVDLFKKNNLLIVGPSRKASLLETSKAFAKMVMLENDIPTAGYEEFFSAQKALHYIENSNQEKMVVKCDGLAQGKGVIVCQSKEETKKAVNDLMNDKFLGENVDHIIIEECLEGVEVSAFALCDGENFSFLGTACDHKRLRDGDQGPNTGGMGVYSPAGWVSKKDEEWICESVFKPLLLGMKKRNTPFSGVLFAGLMKTLSGFKVLEFNVRFGDPETQVLLPLLQDDIVPWFLASAKNEIQKLQNEKGKKGPEKKSQSGVHVVMAAHGYPGTEGVSVRAGDRISFAELPNPEKNNYLFCAGVEKNGDTFFTKGGRVLGVTSFGKSFTEAREKAYGEILKIHFEGAQYRSDIGKGQN